MMKKPEPHDEAASRRPWRRRRPPGSRPRPRPDASWQVCPLLPRASAGPGPRTPRPRNGPASWPAGPSTPAATDRPALRHRPVRCTHKAVTCRNDFILCGISCCQGAMSDILCARQPPTATADRGVPANQGPRGEARSVRASHHDERASRDTPPGSGLAPESSSRLRRCRHGRARRGAVSDVRLGDGGVRPPRDGNP